MNMGATTLWYCVCPNHLEFVKATGRRTSPVLKGSVSACLMWGSEICRDLNYFSFLITQYVNTFPPCKILKRYLISYDCIQLQAIKNSQSLKQMGGTFLTE